MKKRRLFFVVSLFTLLLLSCRTATKGVEDSNPSINDISQKNIEKDVSTINRVLGEYWGEDMLGFQGIISQKKSRSYGNLEANIKTLSYIDSPSLVCVDKEKGIIYYVNYGKDNYIYQLKGEENTLLLETGTSCIQLWEEELYFLGAVDSYLTNKYEKQSLYKYNLNTKEVTPVIDEDIVDFCITSEGIYYSSRKNSEIQDDGNGFILERFYRSFKDNIVERNIEIYNHINYKDYEVIANAELIGFDLRNMDTLEIIKLAKEGSSLSIVGDQLCFYVEDELYCVNLRTGRKFSVFLKEYAGEIWEEEKRAAENADGFFGWSKEVEEALKLVMDSFIIRSYIVMDGNIYVVGKSAELYIVNIETHEVTTLKAKNTGKAKLPSDVLDTDKYPRVQHPYAFDKLYTSGDRLFAVASYPQSETRMGYEFVELIIEDAELYVIQLSQN